ncbi:ketoacyl-ACP synthase III family protein [Micromonospora sp. KC721]|uniref:ketoacyl-ACP synthase III family protein n=1 Tax=Micromonospora sp. KC721 TaxID=2530380 RepID=UPI00104933EC|nr:ketoacyl-ACP synthase III family protein [Micromonospora sp. KC721]TDB81632.1 3-oxoacyl-ACP synthase [Micromonospora sp. KC721]
MRWNDVFIGAAAASLGHAESTDQAVADGRYPEKDRDGDGYLSVRVVDHGPAVDLAVAAGRLAVDRSGHRPEEFALVTHSHVGFQGLDDFASAAHVQRRTIGGPAVATEVRQASNGGMAALELAAAYLSADPGRPAALLTTSDVFHPPAYDRWGTSGTLYGDGGTALVLSRGAGVARLLSSVSLADTSHEGLQVGDEPWTEVSGGNGWPIDTGARIAGYVRQHGEEIFIDLVRRIFDAERRTVQGALADADVDPADIAWWVFPNMGLSLTDWDARAALGVNRDRTTWPWGRRCGHLGAGDQFAALAYLLESRRVRVGDRVLVNGAGTGFTFTSAVLEIQAEPEWTISAD